MSGAAVPKRERDTLARMDAAFDKVDALLLRLGQQGLQRATASSAAELTALKQTAHNAALVGVARELEVMITLLERYLDRDPLFAVDAWLTAVNRVWLLNRAARARRASGAGLAELADLVGRLRRQYDPVDEPLTLQALGAAGWVSDADFVGVTVHLVDLASGRLLQAVSARPCAYFGRDPRRLLRQPVHDALPQSLDALSHGAWRWEGARCSADGRLSIHAELGLTATAARGVDAYAALAAADWLSLVDRLRLAEVHPLRGAGAVLAYLEPARIGRVVVDAKAAKARLALVDGRGAALEVRVPLSEENNLLVDNLERLASPRARTPRPDGLFGRAFAAGDRLVFQPWTAVFHAPVVLSSRPDVEVHGVHLTLEPLAQVRRAQELP